MRSILFCALALLSLGMSQAKTAAQVEGGDIRFVPMKNTPQSEGMYVGIALPRDGDVVSSNPVWIQLQINGYPLGMGSQFDRQDEIAVSELGQTVHVVIDNRPYIAVNGPPLDPFYKDGFYYDSSYKFELPYGLSKGEHVIRVFPARSYGESLKGEKMFAVQTFYLGQKVENSKVDLSGPYLTYNEPSDLLYLTTEKPVLLDFYVTNISLSSDGYKIKATVDKSTERMITSWQPYYIYGLTKGKHTLRLQLVDERGRQVPGEFNDVTRTFTVH